MPKQQDSEQKKTIGRVMHEFKEGELQSGTGGKKVRNPKQAIAIALSESGSSREQSPAQRKRSLARTKAKESRGETASAEKEGRAAQERVMRRNSGRTRG